MKIKFFLGFLLILSLISFISADFGYNNQQGGGTVSLFYQNVTKIYYEINQSNNITNNITFYVTNITVYENNITQNVTYNIENNITTNVTYYVTNITNYDNNITIENNITNNITYYSVLNDTFNATYNTWAYNQTTPFQTWLGTFLYNYNQSSPFYSWLATFNYNYNQTTPFTNWLSGFLYNYNQTNTNTFNATYDTWAYNQSDGSYNATYQEWAHNQSNLTWTYYFYNQTNTNMFNATYNEWAYNQSNLTWAFNQSDGSYNATYQEFAYNQTTPAMKYEYNQSLMCYGLVDNSTLLTWTNITNPNPSIYNVTYQEFAYNQSNLTWAFNQTDTTWLYNQTTPFQTWLAGFAYNYNQTNTNTFNATYDTWAYNQTSPFQTWLGTFLYNYNQTITTWSYNQTPSSYVQNYKNIIMSNATVQQEMNGSIRLLGNLTFAINTSSNDTIFPFNFHGFTRLDVVNEGITRKVINRDTVFIAKNPLAVTINKGQAVYISGGTGNVANVGLALANQSTTLPAVGVALNDIPAGAFGEIMKGGILENYNTNSYNDGDTLYVSITTAGGFQNTRPTYPYYIQKIGEVIIKNAGAGQIFITPAPFLGGMESGTINTNYTFAGNVTASNFFGMCYSLKENSTIITWANITNAFNFSAWTISTFGTWGQNGTQLTWANITNPNPSTYNATYHSVWRGNSTTLSEANITNGARSVLLNMSLQNITWNSNNIIYDNTTCITIKGSSSTLYIC